MNYCYTINSVNKGKTHNIFNTLKKLVLCVVNSQIEISNRIQHSVFEQTEKKNKKKKLFDIKVKEKTNIYTQCYTFIGKRVQLLQEFCYIVCVRKPLTVIINQKLWPRSRPHKGRGDESSYLWRGSHRSRIKCGCQDAAAWRALCVL